MSSASIKMTTKKKLSDRILSKIESLGNLLPHPVTLFFILCLVLFITSEISEIFNISVVDPRPEGSSGRAPDGMIKVISLANAQGIEKILTSLVTNFVGFAPLGMALVAMLGISIAEGSGWLSATMRLCMLKASNRMVTTTTVFVCIISSAAMPLGYVVLIPLAAMLFHSIGRHPIAGLAAAYAGVGAGYSANLVISTIDPLLSGITQTSAQLIDPNYSVGAEANWYFMSFSTLLLTLTGVIVTERYVEPKLGKYQQSHDPQELETITSLKENEIKGVFASGFIFCLLLGLISYTIIPNDGILRSESGSISGSPFFKGIVAFIFILFSIPGITYGIITGSFKDKHDIITSMIKSISSMSMFIVLMFFASQFIAWFSWTNIATVLAISGANFLREIGFSGPMLLLSCIAFCAILNLIVVSSAIQWAIMAPIIVPMLMLVGYAPETVQVAYRIGDSVTNIITPMMPYFGMVIVVALKYVKNIGIGTLISIMIPYSFAFLLIWSCAFYLWVFVFNIPVGPGSSLTYQAIH